MIETSDPLLISAQWYNRSLSGQEFLRLLQSFVHEVIQSVSGIATVEVVRDPKESTGRIDPDFKNFDREVVDALPKEWAYINADRANKSFSLDCRPAMQFYVTLRLLGKAFVDGITLVLRVGGVAPKVSNQVRFEAKGHTLSTQDAKALLETTIRFWQPTSAYVTREALLGLVDQPKGSARVGLITYLSDTGAGRFVPDGIQHRRLDEGILVFASESLSAPVDKATVDTMIKLVHELDSQGLLAGR